MKAINPIITEQEGFELLHEIAEEFYHLPLVSIIVNNYNYARFLREAIDSALDQTYSPIEVIVVDDGSTDNSQEIIATYKDKIVPVFKKNGGQASAFNAGFAVSHGEIVMFLDADDYLFPRAVERVVTAWEPDVAKVHYRLVVIDAFGKSQGLYPSADRTLDHGEVWRILLAKGRYGTSVTSGNGFSRAVLDKILPVPENEFKIAADGYLVNLVPFYGQVVSIEQPLGSYRIHGSNSWALNKVEIDRFRKFIQHDLQRYELLKSKASEYGYTQIQDLSCRDYLHLQVRISSLRLNPQNHPVSSDSRLTLSYKGVWAVWRYSEFAWKKRLLLSMWFIWVGLMPLPMVKPAISWLFVPQSRPISSKSSRSLVLDT